MHWTTCTYLCPCLFRRFLAHQGRKKTMSLHRQITVLGVDVMWTADAARTAVMLPRPQRLTSLLPVMLTPRCCRALLLHLLTRGPLIIPITLRHHLLLVGCSLLLGTPTTPTYLLTFQAIYVQLDLTHPPLFLALTPSHLHHLPRPDLRPGQLGLAVPITLRHHQLPVGSNLHMPTFRTPACPPSIQVVPVQLRLLLPITLRHHQLPVGSNLHMPTSRTPTCPPSIQVIPVQLRLLLPITLRHHQLPVGSNVLLPTPRTPARFHSLQVIYMHLGLTYVTLLLAQPQSPLPHLPRPDPSPVAASTLWPQTSSC
eukprot:GHVU01157656.1.p2 GENE.GHVU01157656.1~~GHVU01157656.1.p2  ORF type:complete len:312 (-),score=0.07 GHVU01157656.1:47-982(-)